MFDLAKQKISIACPSCKRNHQATLQQVANGATIKCICSTNIVLHDKGRSTKQSINQVNTSMKKLNNVFKQFGK